MNPDKFDMVARILVLFKAFIIFGLALVNISCSIESAVERLTPDEVAPIVTGPTVSFSATSSSAAEAAATHNIAVNLSTASTTAVTVNYSVNVASTATGGGADYTLASGTLTFPAGVTTQNISVVIADDATVEPNETLVIDLASPAGASLGASVQHTALIQVSDAINFTWIGGGGNSNWSTAANWQGGVVPGAADVATFTTACAGAQCNVTIDQIVSVDGIDMKSDYTGTITQGAFDVTSGASEFKVAGGTFVGHATSKIVCNGHYNMSGGTVTLNGANFEIARNFTYTAGTVNWNSSKAIFNGATAATVSTGATFTFGAVDWIKSGIVMSTLTTSLKATGTLTINSTAWTSGTSTFNARGDVNMQGFFPGEGPIISISDSTANQTLTGTSGAIIKRLTINKPSGGTLTLAGTIDIGERLTMTAGTVSAGTSHVRFVSYYAGQADVLINSPITFYDVSVLNGTSGVGTEFANGDLVISRNLVINLSVGTAYLFPTNTEIVKVGGNVNLTSGYIGTRLELNGSGVQTLTGAAAGGTNDLRFNSTGTVNLVGTVNVSGLLYSQGTFNAGTSKVVMYDYITNAINMGAQSLYDLDIDDWDANVASTVTITGTLSVTNNLRIMHSAASTAHLVNGGTMAVGKNLTVSAGSGGTTNISLVGTTDQSVTHSGGTFPNGTFTVNKATGNVVLASHTTLSGGADLTLTAGTINMAGYNLTGIDTLSTAASTAIYKGCGTLGFTSHSPSSGSIYDGTYGSAISIADDTSTEGTDLDFVVTVSPQNCMATTFNYATSDGTATTADSDYTSSSGSTNIPANTSSITLSVTTGNDAKDEPNESVTMTLSSLLAGVTPTDLVGAGTINDNDSAPTISIADITVSEGSNAALVVTLSSATGYAVTFDWATSNGDATQPGDYTSNSGTTVTIAAGQTTVTLPNIVTIDDATVEANEYFTVTLSNVTNVAGAGNDLVAAVTLVDKVSAHSVSIAAAATYTNDSTPDLTLAATGATEMYITNTAGCGAGGAWVAYSTSSAGWALGQTNGTATVYAKFRNAGLVESSCVNDTITHDDVNPSVVTTLDDGTTSASTTDSPTITYTAATDATSGVASYELAIGTSSGGTQTLNWTNIGNVVSYQRTGLTLTPGTTYYASIRAVDNAGNTGAAVNGDGWSVSSGITTIYRSVGVSGAVPIVAVSATDMTIAGGIATFGSALPNIVGVGDAIQYDSDNNGSIDSIMFIHGRTDSTHYTVATAAGGVPANMALADQNWSIFRAYRQLENAIDNTLGGTENTGIDAAVRDFDSGTFRDLATNNTQWNVAIYGGNTVDLPTNTIVTSGWTTTSTKYLRIYTPYLATEVGVSQRHSGVWNASLFYNQSANSNGTFSGLANNIWFDGLQLQVPAATSNSKVFSIQDTATNVKISNCIIRAPAGSGTSQNGIDFLGWQASTERHYVYNNIFYGFKRNGTGVAVNVNLGSGDILYFYNNTVAGNYYGVYSFDGNGANVVLKNNLVSSNTTNYTITAGPLAGSTNNLSSTASAPGANPISSASVTFADTVNDDYRIDSTDTVANGAGFNLSGDGNIAFDIDASGANRAGAWDVGAMNDYVVTTFTVNTTNDTVDASIGNGICADAGGACSLRAAIEESNSLVGPQRITLPAGNYVITSALPNIDDSLNSTFVINGNSSADTIIDLNLAAYRFNLPSDDKIYLKNVRIQGARASSAGGAIATTGGDSDIVLSNCIFSDNRTSVAGGGAINSASNGDITISNCKFIGNQMTGAGSGGAIRVTPASFGTNISILNSEFGSNTNAGTAAAAGGGALYLNNFSSLTIGNSSFYNNVGGSTTSAKGGAMRLQNGAAGTVFGTNLFNSTFDSNSALGGGAANGGAIYVGHASIDPIIVNSTFSNNSAGAATTGGAFQGVASSDFTLTNNIFINNKSGGAADICGSGGGFITGGNNISDMAQAECNLGVGELYSKTAAEIGLAGIADNGGPVMTMALLAGSLALDAGHNATCATSTSVNNVDARGLTRPVNGGSSATCDIGAYEAQSAPTTSFFVNSTGDSTDASAGNGICEATAGVGDCTLRAAIVESNSLAGTQTISVPAGTYSVGSSIPVSASVNIVGAGKDITVIDGGNATRVFNVTGGSFTLSNFTGQNGNAAGAGAGGFFYINQAAATLSISDCRLYRNTASVWGGAIGVQTGASVTINRCNLENNTAGAGEGGAVNVFNTAPTALSVSDSRFSYNTAAYGAAINLGASGLATSISNSTFDYNSATADGGAVYSNVTPTSTLTNSTFFNNTSTGHGMAWTQNNSGTLNVTNSSFVGNSRAAATSGPLRSQNSSTINLKNSLFFGNYAGTVKEVCITAAGGVVNRNAYNLFDISDAHCAVGATDSVADAQIQMELKYSGGYVPTLALSAGSPAIDGGDSTGAPATDARGLSRVDAPRANVVSTTDIGSYEYQNNSPPLSITYNRTWRAYLKNYLISSLTPTVNGTVTSYSVSPTLPSGLSISSSTGVISGTPSVTSAVKEYTITGSNSDGSVTTKLSIGVYDGYVVNSTGDQDSTGSVADGVCNSTASTCTLRAAIKEANGTSGAQAIYVPDGTITLATQLEDIGAETYLIGQSKAGTIIDGNNAVRFHYQTATVNYRISDVTLKRFTYDNVATGNNGSVISYNGSAGSGVYLSNVLVDSNSVTTSASQIIYTFNGFLDIEYTTISNNTSQYWGAGIGVKTGTATIRDSVIESNTSNNGGAGMDVWSTSTINIYRSLFKNNSASSGVGGAANFSEATVNIENTTFSGNSAGTNAGAISTDTSGVITIVNSTFKGNTAVGNGGGVVADAVSIYLYNTVLDANTAGASANCYTVNAGTITHASSIETSNTCGFSSNGSQQNITTGAINLGALSDNGGPVHTFMPAAASVLVDSGNNAYCKGTDARNIVRPKDSGNGSGGAADGTYTCDVGAVER